MAKGYFTQATFRFLAGLRDHNNREWFDEHRQDYETHVREPALDFIGDMAAGLGKISPHFLAVPKKVGGSLMRVHRDIRFARDKQPYKTNIGIQFRHELGKDVHAPGYYLHVEPGGCFVGVGLWRPDADALGKIRDAVARDGKAWLKARDDATFRGSFDLAGESLATAPRGYATDHPLVEDLKRKDFVALAGLDDADVTDGDLTRRIAKQFAAATPYMRFLCRALDLQF